MADRTKKEEMPHFELWELVTMIQNKLNREKEERDRDRKTKEVAKKRTSSGHDN